MEAEEEPESKDDDELVAEHADDDLRRQTRNSPDSAAVLPLVDATSELLAVDVRGERQLLSEPVAKRLSSAEEDARARLRISDRNYSEYSERDFFPEPSFFFPVFDCLSLSSSLFFPNKTSKQPAFSSLAPSATFFSFLAGSYIRISVSS